MPRLQDTSNAVVVGAVVVLLVACAPRSARWSASSGPLARCNGVAVLNVQNDLRESIQIFELPRPTSLPPMPMAVLGPGWHTLEIDGADKHRYLARTVGQSSFTSYPVGGSNDPRVRMTVGCRATG
jgi:hypothetical protein